MLKEINAIEDTKVYDEAQNFIKNVNSDMHYKSEISGNAMSFEWINEIEFALSYIDNIVRVPKVTLVNEENVVKIEKTRKITVASVKDLTRHTHYIEKVDKLSNDVQPSKILEVRSEETYNTYENRFVYTLIDMLTKFVSKKEEALDKLENKNDKTLEYEASTTTKKEKIEIELKINCKELPKAQNSNEAQNDLEEIRERIKRIKQYISSWYKSEFIKALEKSHVALVTPPISKTNLILKNPNFQIATRLWNFLQMYDLKSNEQKADGLDTSGNNTLKDILDEAFLTQYFVLSSVSNTKREQKEKLSKYAIVMLKNQVQRSISLLLNCGVKITDEEILQMVAEEIKNEKSKKTIGSNDVRKKFKSAMDEYLESTQNYL